MGSKQTRKDTKFNVGVADDTLTALFECKHGNDVCAKCIGRGKCEHDCSDCFGDTHGAQLNLFSEGN